MSYYRGSPYQYWLSTQYWNVDRQLRKAVLASLEVESCFDTNDFRRARLAIQLRQVDEPLAAAVLELGVAREAKERAIAESKMAEGTYAGSSAPNHSPFEPADYGSLYRTPDD